jgi:hypothetical protein
MVDKNIPEDTGPEGVERVFEQKYCGDLPRLNFDGLLLEQIIEVI